MKKRVFFTFLESVETNGKTDTFEQKSQKFTSNLPSVLLKFWWILMDFWTFRKGVPLWKNVHFDGFFAFRKGVPLPVWKNTDVYNFFVIFTIYTLLLALKSQQTVVWLKGHQFWEVDFWWLFGHFTICKCFLALKS